MRPDKKHAARVPVAGRQDCPGGLGLPPFDTVYLQFYSPAGSSLERAFSDQLRKYLALPMASTICSWVSIGRFRASRAKARLRNARVLAGDAGLYLLFFGSGGSIPLLATMAVTRPRVCLPVSALAGCCTSRTSSGPSACQCSAAAPWPSPGRHRCRCRSCRGRVPVARS